MGFSHTCVGRRGGDDLPVVAVTVSPAEQAGTVGIVAATCFTHTSGIVAGRHSPIPSELELLLQRLLGDDQPVQPLPNRKVGNHRNGNFIAKFASGLSVSS